MRLKIGYLTKKKGGLKLGVNNMDFTSKVIKKWFKYIPLTIFFFFLNPL